MKSHYKYFERQEFRMSTRMATSLHDWPFSAVMIIYLPMMVLQRTVIPTKLKQGRVKGKYECEFSKSM